MVAPGAIRLAHSAGQLFGGQPVAIVAEVGHTSAHRVVHRKHSSVHRSLGQPTGDSLWVWESDRHRER